LLVKQQNKTQHIMRKFVLIALVALLAVAAAQEITDFKFKNLTHSNNNNKTSNKSLFANKTGGGVGNNIIIKSKNFTNHGRLVANKTGSWLNKNKNFSKNITGKISNLLGRLDKKNTSVVGRPNRIPLRPNHTILGRPNRTFIGRPNKTNRTNKTGRIPTGLKSWPTRNGLEDEESSEATEDFSAVGPKNHTSRNRSYLKGRPEWSNKSSKSNKTGKTVKASNGGFFEAIKSWFFAEDDVVVDEEEEDYTIKNKTVSPKNKSVGLWGKVSSWFGGKKNDTKKPQPQKKNTTTNVTPVQNKKKNSSSSSNKTQPEKKNISNKTQPQKKNSSNKTQPQKKNTTTTNVTQVQKNNGSSNKTQPKKNISNKTQPQKNNSQKNQTKKINQLELEDLAWNSDKKPTPGLLGSSLPPF
jgi:hypothetical protein